MDTVTASTTLLGDTTLALRRAPAVPALCEAGAIVRALLFVRGDRHGRRGVQRQRCVAVDPARRARRGHRGARHARVAVRGLQREGPARMLPGYARLVCVGAVGAGAAAAACVPVRLVGIDVGNVFGVPAIVVAGAVLGAIVYHWLELRVRALLPLATEAGLIELQSRVQPHFLFNTLNTAIALVRIDPERAEEILENLAELFRAALGALEGESTLGEEIRLARMYLSIEGMRFGKRLEVDWDIDDAVDAARVPPLLLQPLVENAVRHGVEPNGAGGRVQIRARVRNRLAWVQVTNTMGDGPGPPGHGIGLASARERLRLMHDLSAEFSAGPTTTAATACGWPCRFESNDTDMTFTSGARRCADCRC
jgi:signal transduction histidine kinase